MVCVKILSVLIVHMSDISKNSNQPLFPISNETIDALINDKLIIARIELAQKWFNTLLCDYHSKIAFLKNCFYNNKYFTSLREKLVVDSCIQLFIKNSQTEKQRTIQRKYLTPWLGQLFSKPDKTFLENLFLKHNDWFALFCLIYVFFCFVELDQKVQKIHQHLIAVLLHCVKTLIL